MAFVVTRGELAAVDRAVQQRPSAIPLTDTLTAEYAYLWRTQPAIRTVVSFLARNVGSLPLQTYQRAGDNDRRRITDPHPLPRLLGEPQPGRGTYALLNSVMHDLGIYDRAYRIKVRGDGTAPRALVRAHPRKMRVTGESPFAVGGYRLMGARGHLDFNPSQVLHWHGYDPDDDRDGCSPIESLRRTLLEEHYASEYRSQLWRNGARMSGYLKRPAGAPDWSKGRDGTEPPRERFRRDWRAQYSGDGPQAGGTPILEDGMEWVAASITPEQAQALDHRKLSREEAAAAYFIPPPMIGILDHATFSNVKEQHKHLYQDTLGPWLVMLQEGFDLQLVPDFGSRQLYVEFNLAAKLAGSFEERAAVLQTAVGAPYLTRNEARALDNRAPLPGGDDLVTPLNVLIGGQASPTDSAPVAPPKARRLKARPPAPAVTAAEKTIRAHFDRQGRAVVSALGGEKARKATDVADLLDRVFDKDRWDRELAADLYAINVSTSAGAAEAALGALGWAADRYDESRTLAFLSTNAERVAGAINGSTYEGLKAALDAVLDEDYLTAARHLFEVYRDTRAPQIAKAQTTAIAGFGTTEVARQYVHDAGTDPDRDPAADPPEAVKTWRTTSDEPRASHKALDGVTVLINDLFPNGAQWPGDSDLPPDERAGCTCDVDVEVRA